MASCVTQSSVNVSSQFQGEKHTDGRSERNEETNSQISSTHDPIIKLRDEFLLALGQSEMRHHNQITEMREDFVIRDIITKAVCLESYTFSVITHGLKLNQCTANSIDLKELRRQGETLGRVIAEFERVKETGNRTAIQAKSDELATETKTCEEKVRAIYDQYYKIAQKYAEKKIYENQSFEKLNMDIEAQAEVQAENQLVQKYPNFLSRTWHRARGEKSILIALAKNNFFQKFVDKVAEQATEKGELLNFFKDKTVPRMAL